MYEVVYNMTEASKKGLLYTDLTGRFPYRSSQGHEYIFVGFHCDTNAVLVEPIKNTQADSLIDAWTKMKARFVKAGVQPHTYIMNNEISRQIKDTVTASEIKYQLIPQYYHRANIE